VYDESDNHHHLHCIQFLGHDDDGHDQENDEAPLEIPR